MTRTPYMKRALGIVGITVMSFGLSACLQDKANWSQNDTIKRNSVTLHHLTHDLQFAADQTGITDAQAAELNRFLARSMAGYGDTFTIDFGLGSRIRGPARGDRVLSPGAWTGGFPSAGGLRRFGRAQCGATDPQPLCRHAAAVPGLAQTRDDGLQQSGRQQFRLRDRDQSGPDGRQSAGSGGGTVSRPKRRRGGRQGGSKLS